VYLAVFAVALAILFAWAADPTPTPAPVVPEIGRARASAPACSVLNELIAPSFTAVQNADQRFADASANLPDYARIIDDPFNRFGPQRESLLSKIDSALIAMQNNARAIYSALNDPRLSKTIPDADVQTERAQLEQVYATQMARIKVLNEFVLRQQVAIMRHDTRVSSIDTSVATPSPQPGDDGRAPVFGQPHLQGIGLNDSQQMSDWTLGITVATRRSEAKAAQALGTIAGACR
jgi:hypothetical protein